MIRAALFWIVCATFLLSSCGGSLVIHDASSFPENKIKDAPFAMQGRFSAQAGDDVYVAAFDWRHAPPRDAIDFVSPLGNRIASLTRDEKEIVIMRGNDNRGVWQGSDLQTLTQETLGFPLPVDGLIFWIRGIPTPRKTNGIALDAQGRLAQLKQEGWVIDYQYARTDAALPLQIDARYGETISLRIRIDAWLNDDND
ncbi:MAG: lipoprotein insertase outer membrane protein LolB [Burkholderiales bacterium]|nr:lipoprotein insertase outer membrane protein LolB [Burkholderiales bacterium]